MKNLIIENKSLKPFIIQYDGLSYQPLKRLTTLRQDGTVRKYEHFEHDGQMYKHLGKYFHNLDSAVMKCLELKALGKGGSVQLDEYVKGMITDLRLVKEQYK